MGELYEFSDHCPIEIIINNSRCFTEMSKSLPNIPTDTEQTSADKLIKNYKNIFFADKASIEKLKAALESEQVNDFIQMINDQLQQSKSATDIDIVVDAKQIYVAN